MWMKIAGAIVLVIGGVLAFAATRPDSFRVERSTHIKAPPDKVYAQVQDFKSWAAWSPWEKMEPAMQKTYSANSAGVGATYGWKGDKTGAGGMKILEAKAASFIKIQLDFSQPFEAHNLVEFSFAPKDGGTQATWAMHGPSNLMTKVIHLFMPMDQMVGKDFESGLRDLKAAAEK